MSLFSRLFRRDAGPDLPAPPSADLTDAASRLRGAGRIPVNIWGDVMLDGSPLQVRRVIAGQQAHECLLVYYYLGEILTLNEMVRAIGSAPQLERSIRARFDYLKSKANDLLFHANDELVQVFAPVAILIDELGADNVEFSELGCSFFSALDKLRICMFLLDRKSDITKMRSAAIDHSEYFLRGSVQFHRDYNVRDFLDYKDWTPVATHSIHLSRFVASYAMQTTDEFATWMANYAAFHIIDVVNSEAADFQTSNNGLRQIFLNFPKIVSVLNADGWNVYLNEIAPDYNSGRKCAVVKLMAVRRSIDEQVKLREKVLAAEGLSRLAPMHLLTPALAEEKLKEALATYSAEQWQTFVTYKKAFPVWGAMQGDIATDADFAKRTSDIPGISTRQWDAQLNYYLRKELQIDQA